MVTIILESSDIDIMMIAKLGSIESHIRRILEKTEKSIEEALKSQVNLTNDAESSYKHHILSKIFHHYLLIINIYIYIYIYKK